MDANIEIGGGAGHRSADAQIGRARSAADTCDEIRAHHRRRVFAMEQRKRADQSLGWFLKTQLGWSKNLPAAERNDIADRAAELVKIGEKVMKQAAKPEGKRKPVEGADDPQFLEWSGVILAALQARAPFDMVESAAEKRMAELAHSLPVWSWADGVRGFGPVSLAVIVGEAGDLSNYANPGKLWKRMGLAPITKGDDVKAGSTWRKGGLTKNDWTDAGYSMTRRSRMFVIGDTLIKTNGDGEFRTCYLERKEYERAKAEAAGLKVAPSASIPKAKAAEYMSDGHVHRRAQRYMEKRLLRQLWRAWNGRGEPHAV
jgi:hypothetical protein